MNMGSAAIVCVLSNLILMGQSTTVSKFSKFYTNMAGTTVNTTDVGGYRFEEIDEQPQDSSLPYYPVLKVSKDGKPIRIVGANDIPLDESDCPDGTCSEISGTSPNFQYEFGPCFGKAIFSGPTLFAYAPESNVFYLFVATQSPILWKDCTYVIYYVDLDSSDLFRVGSFTGERPHPGSLSPINEEYLCFKANYSHNPVGVVGDLLQILRISDGKIFTFPTILDLPTDTYGYYSIHSFHWIDNTHIQFELYAYRQDPGPDETPVNAVEQNVTYAMPTFTYTPVGPSSPSMMESRHSVAKSLRVRHGHSKLSILKTPAMTH